MKVEVMQMEMVSNQRVYTDSVANNFVQFLFVMMATPQVKGVKVWNQEMKRFSKHLMCVREIMCRSGSGYMLVDVKFPGVSQNLYTR